MTSPVDKRIPPPQVFEQYTFNYAKSIHASLSKVSSFKLKRVPGATGSSFADDQTSSVIDIGFGFKFNETTYTQFVVSTNGFMVLVDPAVGSFSNIDVFSGDYSDKNDEIISTFLYNHVLLAPWFDNLMNSAISAVDLYYGPEDLFDTIHGINTTYASQYDDVRGTIKYVSDVAEDGQRRLVVRWGDSYSTNSAGTAPANITFEVVLYEDGKIEYRYAPLKELGGAGVENATIGIFITGNRFRDMCSAVGYTGGTGARKVNPFGGYQYSSSYADPYASYAVNLKTSKNWPAGKREHAIFTFTPPQRRRQVLPRPQVSSFNSTTSYPRYHGMGSTPTGRIRLFDDRLSLKFTSGSVVDMSVGLPRDFANGLLGAAKTANLFNSASIVSQLLDIKPQTVEQFVLPDSLDRSAAFNDHGRPEQGRDSNFYSVGTGLDDVGFGFESPLRSKTQLRFDMPVTKKTVLFDVSSSIHYYNPAQRGWFIPEGAGGRLDMFDAIYQIALGNGVPYEGGERGFNAVGNLVSSGGYGYPRAYTQANVSKLLSARLDDSLQNNPKYAPKSQECIVLEVDKPFLLEKAVLDVPLMLGPGWFNDRTRSGVTFTGGGAGLFDIGGPAITFAIWNHRRGSTDTYMDLIASGTVIPVGDNVSEVKLESFGSEPVERWISPVGFLAHNGTPTLVVNPNGPNTFTGSVRLEMQAAISNGTVNEVEVYVDPNDEPIDRIVSALTTDKIDLTSNAQIQNFGGNVYVRTSNPFGRGIGGINQSGRSYFGKEFVIPGTTEPYVKNPMYVGSKLTTEIANFIGSGDPVRMNFALSYEKSAVSPYLLLPGDRLVLSVSKVRPKVFGDGADPTGGIAVYDYFTGSIRHDVVLNTGSVGMVLYGSMVKGASEFHDTLTQDIGTAQVHEVIGNDPVVDQFEVEYPGLYEGSYLDDYVVGNLVDVSTGPDGKIVVSPTPEGSRRRRVFSKFRPNDFRMLASEPPDHPEVIENPSKSYRLQPWSERAGSVKNLTLLSNDRIYDSMTPSLLKCWKVDGCHVVAVNETWFQYLGNTEAYYYPIGKTAGMLFNDSINSSYNNTTWTWSFPFEPRYASIPRQKDLTKAIEMVCDKFAPNIDNYIEDVTPQNVINFYPFFPTQLGGNRIFTKLYADVVLNKLNSVYAGFEDANVPNLPANWTTSGDQNWVTQNATTFIGNTAAQAGPITHSQSTTIEYTVPAGLVSQVSYQVAFQYKIDSELGFDFLRFYIDNGVGSYTLEGSFSGPDQPWTAFTSSVYPSPSLSLPTKFKWVYSKDASVSVGTDTAYIDQVQVLPMQYVTSSINALDMSKIMYGFGDINNYVSDNLGSSGYTHEPLYKQVDIVENLNPLQNLHYAYSPTIRGWKYGLSSGLSEYSKVIFRGGRFGQFRDMLEQAQYTRFFINEKTLTDPAVSVEFVSSMTKIPITPDLTWSSNLSPEATSSVPYFDGEYRNRPEINPALLDLAGEVFRV